LDAGAFLGFAAAGAFFGLGSFDSATFLDRLAAGFFAGAFDFAFEDASDTLSSLSDSK